MTIRNKDIGFRGISTNFSKSGLFNIMIYKTSQLNYKIS